jgi:uncharacterized protein YjiS (DUF1127 family)
MQYGDFDMLHELSRHLWFWMKRRRTMAALHRLDARMLADIGVAPDQIGAVADARTRQDHAPAAEDSYYRVAGAGGGLGGEMWPVRLRA